MLYAILCYNDEDVVWSWSKEEDAAVMARLGKVQEGLTKSGKLGPSLRLLPTSGNDLAQELGPAAGDRRSFRGDQRTIARVLRHRRRKSGSGP